MFGPNPSRKITFNINFHHREESFSKLMRETIRLFRKKFHIGPQYEILFYTGSGTLAVEAFIARFKKPLRVMSDDIEQEKFAKRWRDLIKYYKKHNPLAKHGLCVQFETSRSKYNKSNNKAVFTDAISSFPYWPKPKSPAWVTVSSKLLGALPVISILVIKKKFLARFMDLDGPSYLNPALYSKFQKKYQTPFTPAIPLIQDLYNVLRNFNLDALRAKINQNYKMLVSSIGPENILNYSIEARPVITLKKNFLPASLAQKWKIYGYNSDGPKQIFLYSEKQSNYKKLARDIAKSKKTLS